jgi:tape measure domain-containing protein
MATDAELAGSIDISVTQFVAAMNQASHAWDQFNAHVGSGNGLPQAQAAAGATGVAIGNMVAQAATKLAELGGAALMVGIKFDAMKEQAMIAFTNLLGSAQKAKTFMDELAAFAAKTPFEFKELTGAAQRLMAMGFASRDVIPMLTAVGNAVSAMGGSAAMVDRVTTALVQMKAKGKVSAQEMMQLAEAGIPAWEILAKKIGVSIPEAMKLGEKGAISASVAIEGLIEGMNNKFGGMMEAQSQSFNGLMSTLRDLTDQAAGEIMQPIFDASKNVLQNVVKLLPEFKAQFVGAFNEIINAVSVTVNRLAPLVTTAMNDMAAAWKSGHSDILNVTKGVWTAISVGFIEPTIGTISRLISAASQAMAGNWETALRRMLNITDTASNSILSTISRWVQAIARVGGSLTGLSGIASGLSSMGPPGTAKPDTFWKDATGAMREASRAADEAAKAGTRAAGALTKMGGAGGKAKKGVDEVAKALRETLQSLNEWVSASGNGVRISEQAWANATPRMRENLIALRDEFNRNKLATEEFFIAMKGGLLTTMPGMNKAFLEFIDRAKESATILSQHATPKLHEYIQASKSLAKDVEDAEKALDKSNKAIAKSAADAAKEVEKETKRMTDAIMENFERASQALPSSLNSILDSILNMSGRAGDELVIFGTKIKESFGGVLDIVGALPGKIGDKLRQVTDTISSWINKIDSLLKGLHKIFNAIPDGLGGVLEKLTGLFKKTATSTEKVFDEWGVDITDIVKQTTRSTERIFDEWGVDITDIVSGTMKKAQSAAASGMSGLSGIIGKAATGIGAILGSIGTFMGTRNQGKAVGILGGAAAGAGTGAWIGSLFGPGPGTAIGAAIGAGAGAILGLFGSGKSAEQKRAEEEAKQRASLDMQRAAADIMGAQMEGLKKGLELLEGLKTFSEVPRKAIKRFFNEIELILKLFAEMAANFKADSIEQSKALSEIMSSSFGALMSGADLINAIKEVASISEENISAFITTTMKIVTAWGEAASQIEMQTAKFTGKISEKLMSSFAFLQVVPDVIKGFAESVKVDDSVIDAVFATATKFITKMKELSEAQRGMELNRTGASASIFSTIFESAKGMLELFTQLAGYKALDQAILDVITSDLQKLLAWGDSLITLGESGIAKFDTLASVISRMGAAMRNATSGLSALTGGGSSTGITASIQSQNGASYLRGSNSTPSSTTTSTTIQNNNFQIVLSLKDLEELASAPDRLERIERMMNDANSRTGQRAQGYGAY